MANQRSLLSVPLMVICAVISITAGMLATGHAVETKNSGALKYRNARVRVETMEFAYGAAKKRLDETKEANRRLPWEQELSVTSLLWFKMKIALNEMTNATESEYTAAAKEYLEREGFVVTKRD